jgi:hypothetical protein
MDWMKSPIGSDFNVLVGIISGSLKPGTYFIAIKNGKVY